MYGGQEKILGQKVNVKFFTVDPYSVGTGVPRPFSKFANYWKNIFLKIKTSKIKSEKNIYQTIHNTRFIFIFFGIFTIFLYFSRFFENLNSILWKKYTPRYPFPQVTRGNFLSFSDFSYHYQHMVIIGKIRKCPKVAPCDLWKRVTVFLMKSHRITLCKWSWLTLVTSLLFAFYGF